MLWVDRSAGNCLTTLHGVHRAEEGCTAHPDGWRKRNGVQATADVRRCDIAELHSIGALSVETSQEIWRDAALAARPDLVVGNRVVGNVRQVIEEQGMRIDGDGAILVDLRIA